MTELTATAERFSLSPLAFFKALNMSFVAPNWRIQSEYPSSDENRELSFLEWQFLRRNKEYQKEWTNYVSRLHEIVHRVPELLPVVMLEEGVPAGSIAHIIYLDGMREDFEESEAFPELRLAYNVQYNPNLPANRKFKLGIDEMYKRLAEQIEYWHLTPLPLKSERTLKEWEKRVARERISHTEKKLLRTFLGEKWGIGNLENPNEPKVDFFERMNLIRAGRGIYIERENSTAPSNDYETKVFDLRLPLDLLRKQFDDLLALRAEKIKSGMVTPYHLRPARGMPLYREYLRVLDAIDSGVSRREIACTLLKHKEINGAIKDVGNWISAAEKLRDFNCQALSVSS